MEPGEKKMLEGDQYTVSAAGKLVLDAFIDVPLKCLY